MANKSHIVELGDETAIEVANVPFCPSEDGYTGTVQSALFVLNDEKFRPIAICEVFFKSFGKGFLEFCEDGQLGLDEFVAAHLDGNEAIRLSPSLLVSKELCQSAHGVDELESLLRSHEFCGYWLFVHQFEGGEKVGSQMTLGTPGLFTLIDFNDFALYTPSDRTIRYPEHWGDGTGWCEWDTDKNGNEIRVLCG